MKSTKKRLVGVAAVIAGAILLTSCSGASPGGGTNSADSSKTSFIAANIGQIGRVTGAQNPGSQIGMAICEPLTGINEDGSTFMRGAESLTSDDQQTWTVKVAKDRTFSDGTPITAKTYVDTFNFVAAGSNALPSNFMYLPFEGYDELNPEDGKATATELSGLKLVDDSTFTIKTKTPNNDVPYILSGLGFCPMPEAGLKDPTAYDKKPVGNGPYILESLDPQVEAVLVRDQNYKGWVPEGAANKITFRVYSDVNTAYQEVVAGNADMLRSLPPAFTQQARNALGEEGLTAIDSNTLETFFAWPTYLDEKFPKEVRQAFSMLLDRAAISKDLFFDATVPATSLMPNSVKAYRKDACGQTCTFDPQAAKALIDRVGFTGTIPLNYSADNTTDAAVALAISNAAREVGITVEPRPLPGATLGDNINNYALDGPVIQLWGSSFPAPSEWIASVMVDANYRLKYTNEAVSSDIAAALAAPAGDEANALWQKAEDGILADQVMQPLYEQVMYIAHSPCATPKAAGGDMQFYRSNVTCGG